MFDTTQLIMFFSASLILAVTPGPDILYVLTRGITQGRKAALFAALGFNIGVIAHTLFAVVGLSAILRTSALAYQGVKYAGAAYLIYIGIQTWRSRRQTSVQGTADIASPRAIFRQTIIANILNPKVALFFLAFLPQFVRAENGSPEIQMIALGALFMLAGFSVFSLVALFSGIIGDKLRQNPHFEPRMKAVAGSVLVALGLSLALPENR
ncbi:LysE family translocator [Salidesulfovibrio onnuriiensis]|uniref:LysE family translocator n=1 Tax=Salidesulfovibrio onnuriiensis TaxID=2583823 RepID=UPI0011C914E9|nr:LysE family translocator [Salidesulfovibrio onnuriiensis]